MASIRPIGVTSITAGSGIYVSANVGAITIASTGSSSAATVAGVNNQVIYNMSGVLTGSTGFLFDGNQTFLYGNDQGHQQFTTFPGAIFSTRPSTFGGSASFLESPFLFYDGYATGHKSNSEYLGVLIGAANNLGTSTAYGGMISINGLMERRFCGMTYYAGSDNFYRTLIGGGGAAAAGNGRAGIGLSTDSQYGFNAYFSENQNLILNGSTSTVTDNVNGRLQFISSTVPTAGAAFGNDAVQCTIYRSNTGVLNVGPCNVVLGLVTGTTSTNGWPYAPITSGAPVGTPTMLPSGYAPFQVDATNGKLWFYYGGAWHFSLLT